MKPERYRILEKQDRAFFEGIVEKINDDWIVIDNETEEAFPLEDFLYKEIRMKHLNHWYSGILTDDFIVQYENKQYELQDQTYVKIRKSLSISYQAWLEELADDTFFQFIRKLNELNYSIYDIIFCHNHQSFLVTKEKEGVNFFVFDNTVGVCSVHHHFHYRQDQKSDRFEYTLNTGNRIVLQALQRPSRS